MTGNDVAVLLSFLAAGVALAGFAGIVTSIDRRVAEVEERFGDDVPRPDFWGGYLVVPESIEFWQGQVGRLHDRFVYRREGDGWSVGRLAP